MERTMRRARGTEAAAEPADQPGDAAPERPEETPAEGRAAKRPGKPAAKKVKVALSFSEDFARLLGVVSSSLGVDQCDLVERLMRPQLKGCRQPTIPDDLKAMFGRDTAPAS
jgi:hypothetical protein